MLIGIDGSQAAKNQKTGVENYSYELIFNILKNDSKNKYLIYTDMPLQFPEKFQNAKIIVAPISRFWHNLKLPKLISATKPDVFFSPGYMLPIASGTKMAAVVHDFGYKFYPRAYSQKEKFLQKMALGRAVARASAIFFSSGHTMQDFNRFYPKYRGLKEVVYPNYDEKLFSKKSSYRPTKEAYILSVGRLEERKNTKNLIRAYGLLRDSYPKIKHKLVLSGKRGFRFKEISHEINKLERYANDVIITGFVPEKDLPVMYQNASIFVYPSYYEGFGIPILEAFASGVPVACSNASSVPEAAGDGARYFNPGNPKEIAEAMNDILSNPEKSAALVSAGKEQLKKFSWESAAKKVIRTIEKLNG
ncbi:MAG: GDP-mannose-dependent alpha-(1-6)-phosphatidylinositol monomannoside mannosyltransferase [Chloroflexi bacterium ADurb.Bin344]|nr:MAG: GDP-mannose-dependent alpha-(1-6)-phosphatidylinositol monomannoside mannosyltransferase [Chloroflexi bacterium ADurb.Bin344]